MERAAMHKWRMLNLCLKFSEQNSRNILTATSTTWMRLVSSTILLLIKLSPINKSKVPKKIKHITIHITCNADGSDKVESLFIGHANRPLCFKNAAGQHKTGKELGYFYMHNTKAWMTGIFFNIYLQHLNNHVKGRKILL